MLYAAHKAFLETTPDKQKEPRAVNIGYDLPLLPEDEDTHLIWHELGYVTPGEHLSALTFSEIAAYVQLTGQRRSAFVWRMVREMSQAYCVWSRKTGPFQMSPYDLHERGKFP